MKGCLSSLLTSLAELICIYTWIFNISWKILLTLHFDLHFGLHQVDNFWTWNLYFFSFFQYILHRIGLQQMKIYVNFSFWTIEVVRGRLRPLWRPHFDCDLEWPPYIVLWVLFPNNSKFFFVKSCDRFSVGCLGRQMTVGILQIKIPTLIFTPNNAIENLSQLFTKKSFELFGKNTHKTMFGRNSRLQSKFGLQSSHKGQIWARSSTSEL